MPDRIQLALTAFATLRTPSRITAALRHHGISALEGEYESLDSEVRSDIDQKAFEMRQEGTDAIFFSSSDFPERLVNNHRPIAPIIFYRGNKELLYSDGVGMCGSRHVSARGLDAASRCGALATEKGMSVVSGYAAGVDTATHLAALRSGGSTVVVLAEGMDHFRVKRAFSNDFDWDRIVVVSQFAPSQPWRAHAAMARNGIIFGLPKALLVVEAGEKGGTLAAGEGALKLGRTVIAVEFGDETPPGNRVLIEKGAWAVSTPQQLRDSFESVRAVDSFAEPEPPSLF